MTREQRLNFKGAGVELVADALGPADGPPVIFLHGGGQTRHSWRRALGEAARRGYRAISLDLRGHGESGWARDGRYGLALFADDLRQVLAQIGQEAMLVGASLGGLVAMTVAAKPPPRVRALVLVDVTPRIELEGAREVMEFMASAKDGFASLEEAADAVATYLPHRERPKDTSGLARNLRVRDGRYFWHWDPAFMSLGDAAETLPGSFEALQTAAQALDMPTLLIRGARSRIVTEDGVKEFLGLAPHAEYVDIADAHHMVAGDANDAFNDAIFAFLDRQATRCSGRYELTAAL